MNRFGRSYKCRRFSGRALHLWLYERKGQIERDYLTIFSLSFYAADNLRSVGIFDAQAQLGEGGAMERGFSLLTQMHNAQ
jgi:hypothetical protein